MSHSDSNVSLHVQKSRSLHGRPDHLDHCSSRPPREAARTKGSEGYTTSSRIIRRDDVQDTTCHGCLIPAPIDLMMHNPDGDTVSLSRKALLYRSTEAPSSARLLKHVSFIRQTRPYFATSAYCSWSRMVACGASDAAVYRPPKPVNNQSPRSHHHA